MPRMLVLGFHVSDSVCCFGFGDTPRAPVLSQTHRHQGLLVASYLEDRFIVSSVACARKKNCGGFGICALPYDNR